ncbi:DUF4124 domain-containing protein [Pseudomonas sp. LS1212]|uniref:DUF4124 domain-containing protein n=1 Tax=Pseudomonas sp. LS1212 TaxID=2972478 RepID=UPI00215C3E88|nr:DUF4124 domain-containing protein [Pseudomonas sp. LS1212]UVJ44338.1 DUF4124 domain-containing protein [Pseudomonas sp. LS1212]
MRTCLIGLLLVLALPATAQIYKYTDANGNAAYSQQPPNDAVSERVQLSPLNSVAPLPPSPSTPPAPKPRSSSAEPYSILEPANIPDQQAVRANNGNLTVDVRIQPPLQPEHRLRLLLDGQPYGQPGNVPHLQLVNIDRGEHNLAVQVLNDDQVVQQSQTITFTVLRVHLNR